LAGICWFTGVIQREVEVVRAPAARALHARAGDFPARHPGLSLKQTIPMFFCYDRSSTRRAPAMTLLTQADRRAGDRRTDGVTAKILRTVFAMRRGFGNAAAKNLLLRNGHDEAFIERILAIPEDRRAGRRRTDAAAAAAVAGDRRAPIEAAEASEASDDEAVTLDATGMTVLHRLRFEADSGMHRMTLADCPPELQRFGLMQQDRDGRPAITDKGRQALKHFACVRALDSIWRGLDAIPMSDDIRGWLESNLFLQRVGNGYAVTELGTRWLEFNRSISNRRTLSWQSVPENRSNPMPAG
jgi:hypothetical protein